MMLGLVFGLGALLVVLVVIFYAEEDWRGARDWAACQRELAAKGETLDLRQLAPAGKPEDDLSKAPIFAPLYAKEMVADAPIKQVDTHFHDPDFLAGPKPSRYQMDAPIDLEAWQKYYRSLPKIHLPSQPGSPAQDVLQALSTFDPQINEVNKAMENPNAFWPTDYNFPFATILGGRTRMISLASFLQLRALAHLENNETDLAEKDYLASFRLERPLMKSCFLVDYLVMAGVRAVDDSILWEGIRRHAWNQVQLQEMEAALGSIDMLAYAQKAIRTERAQAVYSVKFVQNGHDNLVTDISAPGNLEDRWARFEMLAFLTCRPSGWGDRELIYLSSEAQKQIESIDVASGRLDSTYWENWRDPKTWPDLIKINFCMSGILMAPYKKTGSKIAQTEMCRRLARLGCYLEEYRLAHGGYPEKLEDLPSLPAHLNQEVLSDQPLRYKRKGEGYILYSIGWDQKDDGGKRAVGDNPGDWVWQVP